MSEKKEVRINYIEVMRGFSEGLRIKGEAFNPRDIQDHGEKRFHFGNVEWCIGEEGINYLKTIATILLQTIQEAKNDKEGLIKAAKMFGIIQRGIIA